MTTNTAVSDKRRRVARAAAGLWRKVRRSVKRRGEWGTVLYIAWYITVGGPAMAARKLGLIRPPAKPSAARLFDGQHGVETAEHVAFRQLGITSRHAQDRNPYAPTSPKIFKEMMAHLPIRHQDFTLVDLGCGKGMVLLLAAEYPFRRIIGVEFSAELVARAADNLTTFGKDRLQCRDVQCLCVDAVDYEFPREPLVLYLYNSFKGKVLNRVAAKIARTLADIPRDVFLVYNNPTEPDVFDQIPSLKCIVDDPDFMIYRRVRTTSDRGESFEGSAMLPVSNISGGALLPPHRTRQRSTSLKEENCGDGGVCGR